MGRIFFQICCFVGLWIGIGVFQTRACGPEADMPFDHFPGVDSEGHVSYWDQIGELDLGKGDKLPLTINFYSGRGTTSPSLGKGWRLGGYMDSHMYQVDENKFLMIQPNGTQTYFTRGKSTDTVLTGQGTWMATIQGDAITASASCGGRLIFKKGNLVEADYEKHKLNFVYSGDKLTEMRQGTATLMKVEYDEHGQATALKLGGLQDSPKISLEMGDKPRVEMVGGKNVVGGMDKAVSKVTMSDGRVKTYVYAVNEKLQPTLNIDGKRLISWNPGNSRIIKDGEWTYDIWPGRTAAERVALGRTNTKGQYEFWKLENGKETIQNLSDNGSATVITRAASGIIAGKVRKISQLKNGIESEIYLASFDELGRIVRERTPTYTANIQYLRDEHKIIYRKIDNTIEERLVKINKDGSFTKTITNEATSIRYYYGKDAKIVASKRLL